MLPTTEELRLMPITQLICVMVYMQLLLDPDHTRTPMISQLRAASADERDAFWLKLTSEIDRRLPVND